MSDKQFSKGKRWLSGLLGWIVGTFLANAGLAYFDPINSSDEFRDGLVTLGIIVAGGVYGVLVGRELYEDQFKQDQE